MKIYTKTGDQGLTGLIGGTRVPKHHLRIETYGTCDELNAVLGMMRDHISDTELVKVILEIQDQLFVIGSHLASDPEKGKMKLPEITESAVTHLENEIDTYTATLPELRNFILPGGEIASSWAHIARCVCRRCERLVTHLNESEPVNPLILIYLNRLSDYLFVLSRLLLFKKGIQETPWNPA